MAHEKPKEMSLHNSWDTGLEEITDWALEDAASYQEEGTNNTNETDPSSGTDTKLERSKKQKRKKSMMSTMNMYGTIKKSREYMLLLHALMVHRRLSVNQMAPLYFSGDIVKPQYYIQKLLDYGLVERKRIFSLATSLGETKAFHYGLSPQGIEVYAVLGMEIELHGNPDLPKQHYYHADLLIGKQTSHHYLLQQFLCSVIGGLWDRAIYVPHGEWRRYPFFDPTKNVVYRPDWVVFAENKYFTQIVEAGRFGMDVLSVPLLTREKEDFELLEEHYHPLLSIECDSGTMDSKALQVKSLRIQNEKGTIPKGVAFYIADMNLGYEVAAGDRGGGRARVQNVGRAITEVLELELVRDELHVLVGRRIPLAATAIQYITHIGEMQSLFEGFPSKMKQWLGSLPLVENKAWLTLRMKWVLPEITVLQKNKRWLAFYSAYPCWINPQVRATKIMREYKDIDVVLVYATKELMESDIIFVDSEKLLFVAMDEWERGVQTFYKRSVNRNKEILVEVSV